MRIRLLTVALWLATLPWVACQRKQALPPPSPVPAPPSRPSEFVHPPIPSEPVVKPARAECSAEALLVVAGRVRERQMRAGRALDAKGKAIKAEGCGSPSMAAVDQDVKGPLLDRIRACVAQDETYDPEWNLLDAALSSLAICADCARPAKARAHDCQRTLDLVTQAETDSKKRN